MYNINCDSKEPWRLWEFCRALLLGILVAGFHSMHGQTTANIYQSLDDAAKIATTRDAAQALSTEIVIRTLFGPLPQSFHSRVVEAELDHIAGRHSGIGEASIARAVDKLGITLGGTLYTGTNELQVHLLRVLLFRDIPNLLKSPGALVEDGVTTPEMSPMGAAFLGLLLLRQKLTNPVWFGNPDDQNRAWLGNQRPQGLRVQPAQPHEVTVLINALTKGLLNETSPVTAAFYKFLDDAGF